MSSNMKRFTFQAKAVLCLLLTLQMQFVLSGCGQNGLGFFPAQQFRMPLTANDELSQALRGTPFAGVSAIDIFPGLQQFNLVMPDNSTKLSGKYAFADGEFTITQFFVQNKEKDATITLSSSKQVGRIQTSNGLDWKLPSDSLLVKSSSAQPSGLDAYLAANAGLIGVAKQMDVEIAANSTNSSLSNGVGSVVTPSTTTTPETKATAGLDEPLRSVLLLLAGIWYPLVGILSPLLAVFTVSAVLQNALVLRFDGNWTANNAGSTLNVTISGGKITKLSDQSSGQQITISDSNLTNVDGNNVSWTVETTVLGQSTPVEFKFEVQENANGSLSGTLTTIGNSLARVPLTMIRAS